VREDQQCFIRRKAPAKTAGFSALRGLMQIEKRIESTPSIALFRFRMKSLGESNERQ